MYKNEINLTDVSFIFLRKLASRECVLRGPKMRKIDFGGGWKAVPCPRLYGPGFLDCWAIGPQVKNSEMITDYQQFFQFPTMFSIGFFLCIVKNP